MNYKNQLWTASFLCVFVLCFGTSGYVFIENYSFMDALFMTIITITTVGYGEVSPLSALGRGFTSVLILMGFISLAYAGRIFVESVFENVATGKQEIRKMKKKMSRLSSHYIICGFGRVGSISADYFARAGVQFVIIESNLEIIQKLKEKNYLYIHGDATTEESLLESGVKKAKGLLALLNSDPDNLFVTLSARELNPTLHIIARVQETASENKLYKAGADSVLCPFSTAGTQIAENLLLATGRMPKKTGLTRSVNVFPEWLEIREGSAMDGSEIRGVAELMNRNVIGLRREGVDQIHPDPHTRLKTGDRLLIIELSKGEEIALIKEKAHDSPKLVIVDDNPVIIRLFSRLFRKAGFTPMAAMDGKEGLEIIMREKPAIAVIDYKLPELSGIELCRKIRSKHELKGIKLALFTADDDEATRKIALEAGADAVVVKSPESSEIIETVNRLLKGDSPTTKAT